MTTFTDQQLIAMIQSGDPLRWNQALDYVYSGNDFRIKRQIIYYAKKQGGAPEDGQDICHDAFIIAEKNIRDGRFRGQSRLDSYIIGIAKWLWWNKQRKQKPILGLDLELSGIIEKSVEEFLLEKEQKEIIEQAIQALPEHCREVMALNLKGYSNTEISETLNHQNKKQTENNLTRCRQALREILKSFRL
ncbi:MAG: RNA polymerase sigma factor [Saprospiraceae bacterium]